MQILDIVYITIQMLSTGSNIFSSEIRSSSSQDCSDSAPSYRAAFSLDIQQALDSYNG